MPPLLKTINVVKEYDLGDVKIQALRGVSVEVNKGEFLAIVGKSGSGKSTLMHIMGLLDTPTSGEVIMNEINVTNYKEKDLARIRNKEIGFVFQSFNLLPRTSALDNVILPLKYSDVPRNTWRKKAEDMLNMVDLGNRMNNKSNELSGGQKQRVAIARALVNEPSIIFADEPTGNLDSKTGREITDLFSRLNEQGKTIILVTHDEDLAKIAKRQIIIKDGLLNGE
ncbi:ABC transporter ATP-binding protein [candidate division WWE3 bacterium]|jgi:putative ABC transport system ATP-binding protein|uniref:ABC transporter ATP-binding protein n=1 Tax=candidate division WWE3 bacterium TaxID=2053526 RepID=A0A3A4ZAZ0_UNCKA|nr:MAG: ABC transporter ATP-binding protein [candidate division WWE3 bacterium]